MAITNIVASNSVSTASGDAFSVANGDVLNVFSNGYLLTSASGFSGVYMNGGNSSVMVLGQVWGQNTGIFAQGATAWTKSVTIGASGIVGAVNNGIRAETGAGVSSVLQLNNAGQILSTGTETSGTTRATIYALNAGLDILNSGTIQAHPGQDRSIYATGTINAFTLENTGDINGQIDVAGSGSIVAFVTNHGWIGDDITLTGGLNSSVLIANHGVIEGYVDLTATNCVAEIHDGTLDQLQITGANATLFGRNGTVVEGVIFTVTSSWQLYDVAGSSFGYVLVQGYVGGTLNLDGAHLREGVFTGGGADVITLRGATVDKDVFANLGDDLVDVTGGTILGTVALESGNDTFIGGLSDDRVVDGLGDDLILLGGGNDTAVLSPSEVADNQRDTLDGGLGIDLIDGSAIANSGGGAAEVSLYINLEEGFVRGNPLQGPSRVGVAEISGFENVRGGIFHDLIIGNAGANLLSGGEGFDELQGRDGADTLRGGASDDILQGGGGKDVLAGGAGIDFFVFTAASDSGPTATKRDVIRDFQLGVDKISLFNIDADPTLAGNQAFTFGTQVTTEVVGGNTLVKIDISGTTAPEMMILIIGNITLTAGDFFL